MNFLADIAAEIRREVDASSYAVDLPTSPPPRPASMREAIRSAPAAFAIVAEFKRVAPGSPQRPRNPLESTAFVDVAEAGGATAISCLATRPQFDGSPADVWAVAQRTRLPVLFKDFVIDRKQVAAARRAGASAILLIARLVREAGVEIPLPDLAAEARNQGLEVWLELHDPQDLRVARDVPAEVFGVNVRDLATLRLRPDVAERTFRAAREHRPLLGMSGVRGPVELRHWRELGADGVLVGNALALADEPVAFLRALRSSARESGT